MNRVLKIAVVGGLSLVLIPELCYGQAGRMHRATRRRTTVVVGSSVQAHDAAAASASTAAAQQQTAAAQQQAAAANQRAAAAEQQATTAQQQASAAQQQAAAASAAVNAAPLPVGTVVPTLPNGCTQTAIGGVQYSKCGASYYRAAFQGNTLVYVTAQPKPN